MRTSTSLVASVALLAGSVGCTQEERSPLELDPGSAAFALVQGEQGGRPFHTVLTGAAEAPNPGDPDGSGTASITLNQGQGEVCFAISVSDITLPAVGAHIHRAPAGAPGPVVIGLVPPDATGHSSGCVSADPELIKAIRQSPEGYYVNVHTTDFRPGAVRGQLSK